MMITGDGLSIIIDCKNTFQHNWMAFASCYSIYKNLPDAKICIQCERGTDGEFFKWADKFNAKLRYYKKNDGFLIKPYVMAIRHYYENFGPSDVKADEFTTLVSYENGCGKYEVADKVPFKFATKRFYKHGINSNELKILKMWEKIDVIYTFIA